MGISVSTQSTIRAVSHAGLGAACEERPERQPPEVGAEPGLVVVVVIVGGAGGAVLRRRPHDLTKFGGADDKTRDGQINSIVQHGE